MNPELMKELPSIRQLWDFQNPAASEARFRETLDRALGLGDTTYALELQTQLARSLGLQRKFQEAHAILDKVEKESTSGTDRVRVRYLLERGRVYNSSGEPERATPFFIAAWETAGPLGEDFLAIDAAHMVAISASPENQIEWGLKAIERAEKSPDPIARNWIGPLTNNLGWTYHGLDEFEKALGMFDRSLEVYRQEGGDREVRIARWSRAKVLRKMGRWEESLRIQHELLEEFGSIGEVDGFVFEEIGECLLSLDRSEESKPYFKKAYEELSKDPWLAEAEPDRIKRLKELSN